MARSSPTRLAQTVSRQEAATWANWFKALGDPTRILILNVLATAARPMTTGEVVDALDVGQSTVSHHLQILGETCFVHVERTGTQSWWHINERCMASFPSAAARRLRRRRPCSTRPTPSAACSPWPRGGVAACSPPAPSAWRTEID